MDGKEYSLETPVISTIKKKCGIDEVRDIPTDAEKNIGYSRWLIKQAEKEILIRAGELNSKYYEGLVDSLKKACERGVTIKILFGPYLDVMSRKLIKFMDEYKDKVIVKWDSKREMPHFTVVDSEYLRLEKDHGQLAPLENREGLIGRN